MKVLTFFLAVFTAAVASAAAHQFQVVVEAGKHDRENEPVSVAVKLPDGFGDAIPAQLVGENGQKLLGQITRPGLLQKPDAKGVTLHFILPELKAGKSASFKATVTADAAAVEESFSWHDTMGEYTELRFGSRPVLRYMYKALDDSSKASRELTYKVFHHLYDPGGKRIVTKGPGGRYTHHRGLYYGFNRVSYAGGKKRADVWHCSGDAFQSHEGFVSSEAGPVLGRHTVKVDWHGPGKEVFARELRQMTVYRVPGGQLVEFASRLHSMVGALKLDGDPQHAGFQFRAANEVAAKTKGQTYYLRPDGRGEPGQTRNWDHKRRDPKCVNLPFNAMSFVLGGQRYTAVYLDKPSNPKQARYSERDYGRFGSYFEYELKDNDAALDLNYRIWLQEGELTKEAVEALSTQFVSPVKEKTDRS